MTEEQKEKLIARMLDSPSSLSDEELEMMTLDEELRDIYEISSSVSGACMPAPHLEPSRGMDALPSANHAQAIPDALDYAGRGNFLRDSVCVGRSGQDD